MLCTRRSRKVKVMNSGCLLTCFEYISGDLVCAWTWVVGEGVSFFDSEIRVGMIVRDSWGYG